MPTSPSTAGNAGFPSAVTHDQAVANPWVRRARTLTRKLTGTDLFPEPEQLASFAAEMFQTDAVAERFVAEVYGSLGGEAARTVLDQALTEGIDSVPNPPPAMADLFAEFETVPAWVDPDLIAQGEGIWRRWGTALFSVAGGETLEMYTEAAVAKPLSLAGGYAGDNALRRFLETARFWIDVSQPNALLTPDQPAGPPPCGCGSCTCGSGAPSPSIRSGTATAGVIRSASPTSS